MEDGAVGVVVAGLGLTHRLALSAVVRSSSCNAINIQETTETNTHFP